MRLTTLAGFFIALALSQQAQAVVSLGLSGQNFGLTGIGPNAQGQGQSRMSWGTCTFDGSNTNCSLTGSYTGLGPGGNYNFQISYPGTGTFPLLAITPNASSNQFTASATANFTLVITLTPTTGSPIHFYSFYGFNFVYSSPVCTGVSATNCTVGQVGATPGATIIGPITGTFDTTPYLSPGGTNSAANYGGFQAIAPGTWIEIYGYNLATVTGQTWSGSDFNGVQAPSALGGTTVTVGGLPAYVDYASPSQVNVQVPSGVPAGLQTIVLTTAGGSSLPYPVTVNATEPGMLAPNAFIINGNQYIVALLSNTLTYVLPVNLAGVATARVKPGQSITLYGIGFGTVNPSIPAGQIVEQLNSLTNNLSVTIGGAAATITYSGLAPGYVGLYQINVTVPTVPANDLTPVKFTLGTTGSTQSLYLAVSN